MAPEHTKQYYQTVDYKGFKFSYIQGKTVVFTRREPGKGYAVLRAILADFSDGNFQAMVDMGLSRT